MKDVRIFRVLACLASGLKASSGFRSIFGRAAVLTETKFKIDSVIRRAIAKIAFNYAAHVHGPGFVHDQSFDVARRYVRLGEQPEYPLVLVDTEPILYDDLPEMRQTNGHLITLAWAPGGRDVVAQVSLFNWMRYRISLARNYRGVWRDIRSGHHFDYEHKTIQELRAIPKSLWLPRHP